MLARVDEALLRFIAKVHGAVVALLALSSYLVGLTLPYALKMSVASFVVYNLLGTTIAAVFVLGWFVVQVESSRRRHLLDWTSNLRLLSAREFEWLVGELFKREGWGVTEIGGHGSPDGNIDLQLDRGDVRAVVQCKRWTYWSVGVDEIRRFAGTLYGAETAIAQGIFVTLSEFTEAASAEAKSKSITLIDGRDLHARIERVRRSEPCPVWASPMVLDRSPRGWWLRCVAQRCPGKRDLSNVPGDALALLIDPPRRANR